MNLNLRIFSFLLLSTFIISTCNLSGREYLHGEHIIISGFAIEEEFEGDIYPPKRYLVGDIVIKINEGSPDNPEVEFEYIRFEPMEKYKKILTNYFNFSTAKKTIKSMSILEDGSFSFLIDWEPYNEILVKGTPYKEKETSKTKYHIEAIGNYTHWSNKKLYKFKWKAIPEVILPEWSICYSIICP